VKLAGAIVTVKGEVQGVGFRWWALKRAHLRGVTGWVRNNRDGSVTALAEGERGALDAFIDDLREGPSLAVVRAVDIDWQEYTGTYAGFDITH